VGGEVRYYSVEEAARLLRLTPERVREMAVTGQLDSLPPGATEAGDWKVLLPAALGPEHALPSDQAESTADAPENPPVIGSRSMHVATTAKTPGEDAHQPAGELPADTRQTSAEPVSESGWATTEVAAEALGVSPRTVRDYIANGKLDAKPEGEGVERRWLVSIDSVHTLRQARQSAARSPRDRHAEPRGGESAAEIAADLMMRVQDLQYKLGRAEARAEITERAESTIREERNRLIDDLERERQRADQERERTQRLEAELEALRRRLGAPERAAEQPESRQPRSSTPDPQKPAQPRSWWRRRLGI
jgi:hypothetical protein